MGSPEPAGRGRLGDIVVGGVIGGVVGAIVAVNVVIFAGPDEGYEAGIGDVFDHSAILGLLIVTILACGPLLGIAIARRVRRQTAQSGRSSDYQTRAGGDAPD